MIVLAVILIVLCFSLVVLVGPPYLPTLTPQVKAALDMLDLRPGQTLLELGCGDGKVLIAAARRGWKVTGIELNPILVLVCRLRTWRYRRLVTVRMGNYWDTRLWGQADAIFGFVLPRLMGKLDRTITAWQSAANTGLADTLAGPADLRLASFAFRIPDKAIEQERDGVFLYRYRYDPKSDAHIVTGRAA